MRTPIKAGVAGVALATAGALFLGVPSASGTHQSESSAFGASVGGSPGMPMAQYPEGPRKAGADFPNQLNPLISGGVLTVTAGNDRATAKVTDLTLGAAVADLPPELTETVGMLRDACTAFTTPPAEAPDGPLTTLNELLNQTGLGSVFDFPTNKDAAAFCNALLDDEILNVAEVGTLQTQCRGDAGTVTVEDVSVLGAPADFTTPPAPNTQLLPAELNPNGMGVSITLNRQTQDGDVLTVDGLVLEAGGMEAAVLSSVTCGAPIAHDPTPAPTPTQAPAPAPAPTPVVQNVPVTG